MHNRHGILAQSQIDAIRRALKNKIQEDQRIKDIIFDIDADCETTSEERAVMEQALREVQWRMHYTGLLDSLWAQIQEVQEVLRRLHVYESLERTILEETAESDTDADSSIDYQTVNMNDIDDNWITALDDDAIFLANLLAGEANINDIAEDKPSKKKKDKDGKKKKKKKDKKEKSKDKDKDKDKEKKEKKEKKKKIKKCVCGKGKTMHI